jgi:L-2-hydroxyglutarate oxidase
VNQFDVAIVGGGIVGLATARALAERGLRVTVLEKEARLGAHQTGHNSGVIHSGLYYKPGSLKAQNCVRGSALMFRFCEANGVPFERCGKIVVATRPEQLPALQELESRGRSNGLPGIRRLSAEQIAEYEPHVRGVAALYVPQTGIVDFGLVAQAYGRQLQEKGVQVCTGVQVRALVRRGSAVVVESSGDEVECKLLINCAGLHSDRIARSAGVEPGVRIVPFRGEYYELSERAGALVRNLVYPVPDPRFPFLGVHFTRKMVVDANGRPQHVIEAGPNAVLALKREGYTRTSFSVPDAWSSVSFGGFWRMASRYWQTGLQELWRSWNKRAFAVALAQLVPEIREEDLVPGGAGVRAQALLPSGLLVDDFHIVESERMLHVLNAPSPAATASLSIGEAIAERAAAQLRS